jgi:hypothetical protein
MESRKQQVYNLKLDMLLAVLGANRQTCELWAKVTATALGAARKVKGISGNSTASTIELSIIKGRIRSCVIIEQRGRVQFKGQAALEICSLCGELSWIVRPDQPQSVALVQYSPKRDQHKQELQLQTLNAPASFRVMRYLDFTPDQLNTLPRKDRQVWMILGNGPHEVGELCQLLHLSYEQLIPILNKLAALHIVRYIRDE